MLATREGGLAIYALAVRNQIAPGTDQVGTVQAISAETGEITWVYEQRAVTTSLVATGGGLVFGGDGNGRFRALDHETGEVLWEINLGSPVTGFPITYAVDGRQYVAVSTGTAATVNGHMLLTPGAPPQRGQQPLRVRLAVIEERPAAAAPHGSADQSHGVAGSSEPGVQLPDDARQPFHEIERQRHQPVADPFGAVTPAHLRVDVVHCRRAPRRSGPRPERASRPRTGAATSTSRCGRP